MARFLVTGGAGFMGSHLVDALLGDGHSVRVIDDLSTGKPENVSLCAEFIKGDITDPEIVATVFEDIDGCFHLAAIPSVERSNREWLSTHQVNLTGTINVLNEARAARRGRKVPVIYASTAAVYGDSKSIPLDEEQQAAPVSAYGADKYGCELHARVAGVTHGVPTVGLRFFNLYGPRQDPRSSYSGVISAFAGRLLRGEPVEIYGNGRQIRDFVFVGDAVRALRQAFEAASTCAPVFNVCTGKGTSVHDLARILADLCDVRLDIRSLPPRCADLQISIGNPRRAAEQLGFRANTTLADGLAFTLDALGRFGIRAARAIA